MENYLKGLMHIKDKKNLIGMTHNIAQICEFTVFLNLRIVLISPDVFMNRNVFCFFLHTDLID
jgi:hypothetical protein